MARLLRFFIAVLFLSLSFNAVADTVRVFHSASGSWAMGTITRKPDGQYLSFDVAGQRRELHVPASEFEKLAAFEKQVADHLWKVSSPQVFGYSQLLGATGVGFYVDRNTEAEAGVIFHRTDWPQKYSAEVLDLSGKEVCLPASHLSESPVRASDDLFTLLGFEVPWQEKFESLIYVSQNKHWVVGDTPDNLVPVLVHRIRRENQKGTEGGAWVVHFTPMSEIDKHWGFRHRPASSDAPRASAELDVYALPLSMLQLVPGHVFERNRDRTLQVFEQNVGPRVSLNLVPFDVVSGLPTSAHQRELRELINASARFTSCVAALHELRPSQPFGTAASVE